MKIALVLIDNVSSSSIQKIINEYEERLKHYCRFELVTIIMPKNVRYKSIQEQKDAEQKRIFQQLKSNDYIVLLDEKGQAFTSVEFSQWLQKSINTHKRIVFIIGGPYGVSEQLKTRASQIISLSKMTFSHEIIRVLFLEQVYRAFTILNGQKYHHE